MLIIILLLMIILAVIWKKRVDKKWYDSLSEMGKTEIKELEIRLSEINPKLVQKKPDKYTFYKELYDLSKHLIKDEEITFYIRAGHSTSNNNTDNYVYVTNKKLLIIGISGNNSKSIPFEKINSIDTDMFSLIINDGSTAFKIALGSKENLIRLREEINKGMENHKNISIHMTQTTEKDVADKIARLQVLYEEGVLTEYEFNMKKMELLDKVK